LRASGILPTDGGVEQRWGGKSAILLRLQTASFRRNGIDNVELYESNRISRETGSIGYMTSSGSRAALQLTLRIAALLGLLYTFFISIGLIGAAFKLTGAGFAEKLLQTTADPLVGLFIGILATALMQSSSTTTSIVVGMVGGGVLSVANAIPIVMGANIGTSVTNMIVSVGHIQRPWEFRRAFAAASVHDIFNVLAVIILFPLERMFGILQFSADKIEIFFIDMGGLKFSSPLKLITAPVVKGLVDISGERGWLLVIVAVILLMVALLGMVKILRMLVLDRVESFFSRTIFRTPIRAFVLGIFVTVAVQSSSITTSVVVPLAAAGVLTLEQIFPYTLGANIGTTVTAMLASLATASPAAVTVAFVHLLFNIFGIVLIWPIRIVPLYMARKVAELTMKSRLIPIAYIVVLFFVVPFVVYMLR
jgi:sodium-dependent phosphate cotransporter